MRPVLDTRYPNEFELPEPPTEVEVALLAAVVSAGYEGRVEIVLNNLDHSSGLVRKGALSALVRLDSLSPEVLETAFVDPDYRVRSRAAEISIQFSATDPTPLLLDPDPRVVEVACYVCGEIDWDLRKPSEPTATLGAIAADHADPLCRESAAAALGALGDPAGLEAVLAASEDRVTVRRRAILALAAFDDARAVARLQLALGDRDWQVRQAAEDLLEISRSLD